MAEENEKFEDIINSEDKEMYYEKVKKAINFPTYYLFKIMGKKDEFNIECMKREIEEITKKNILSENITMTLSREKKYVSYTIKAYVENFEDLQKIYRLIKSDKDVLYYF